MAQQKNYPGKKKAPPKRKSKKIIKYRKPLHLNIGMIIFALIFIYMAFNVYTYLKRDKIQFYEVQAGNIVNSTDYTGIILRHEDVKTADRSGYLNYYIREGKRAAVGTRIYSIDETGSVAAYLAQNAGKDITLTSDNLSALKRELTAFSLSYEDDKFDSVYDAKYTLESQVMEYMNFNALDNMEGQLEKAGINFEQVKSDEAGVISYGVDNFEGFDVSGISMADFDRTKYAKNSTKSGALIEKGTPVYKIITSDLWSLVFPMEDKEVKAYGDKRSLTVVFKDRDLRATGDFSMITGTDGKSFGKLDFNKYMVQFVSDRYLDFEIITDKVDGLKIPVSSVTKKDFYLIPADYATQGGNSSDLGFDKEAPSDKGAAAVFVPTTVYYSDGENYYIEMGGDKGFHAGDYVIKPDSTDRYQIGASASLQGVYNINKGYAVFKQIDILASNDEYYTVKKNMPYGLSVYDHIVLDANDVIEGELIYQ